MGELENLGSDPGTAMSWLCLSLSCEKYRYFPAYTACLVVMRVIGNS